MRCLCLLSYKTFETFVEGAKEGFGMSVIVPFLVGMMVAIGLFRQWCYGVFTWLARSLIQFLGIPKSFPGLYAACSGSSVWPLPLEIMNTLALIRCWAVWLLQCRGTRYHAFVLTVYFGCCCIKTRYALAVGLLSG